MWATGTGSDVWKRIAAPMVGGIFTSFVLYPAIYEIWKWHFEMKHACAEPPPGALPSPDEVVRERTYKALHEKAMGGPHAEQVNPELVNSLGQKLGARGGARLKLAQVPLSDTMLDTMLLSGSTAKLSITQ